MRFWDTRVELIAQGFYEGDTENPWEKASSEERVSYTNKAQRLVDAVYRTEKG